MPTEEDMKNILRAADEIIFVAGRTILAKILKGSKDKNVLERALDRAIELEKVEKLIIVQ